MSPSSKDGPVLIPGTCEYIRLSVKRRNQTAHGIQVANQPTLRWGKEPGLLR